MLKERKLLEKTMRNEDIVGIYRYPGYIEDLCFYIKDDDNFASINEEDYYMTEFISEDSESDYHTFCYTYEFEGVYMAFNLNDIDTKKYFGIDVKKELFNEGEFINEIQQILKNKKLRDESHRYQVSISERGYLKVVLVDKKIDDEVIGLSREILDYIRNYYDKIGVHITRMFGSYILLKKIDGELKAVKATPIPIKYCPLMIKLLKEVGGDYVDELIATLHTNDLELQEKCMCKLINETVIKSGYFDTKRPLNSCEANVLFGASETMSSAFKNKIIDAAIIVSNNLGTIITTNEFNTQGAVKRMTGLFHTSPNEDIMNTAEQEGIITVFPYTASIDQLEGVKKAIDLGFKRIAVSVAADDNYLHEELKKLETDEVKIYKFGLCSTGISRETAEIMKENADIVWSCASKYVTEIIEPSAIAQVGIKIPVHIMTKEGWELVRNHLIQMNNDLGIVNCTLQSGEEKPVFFNSKENIKVLQKKYINKCSDCPYPCV